MRIATWLIGGGMLATMAVLGGCSTPPAKEPNEPLKQLTGPQIEETLTGRSMTRCGRRWLRTWQFTSTHNPDGSLLGRLSWDTGRESANGYWETTRDDLYCRRWEYKWGGGKRACFRVSQSGQIVVFDFASGVRADADRYTYRLDGGCP